MTSPLHFIICAVYTLIMILLLLQHPISCQQFYDKSDCMQLQQVPGSNYLCNANRYPCQTFIVYRAQQNFTLLNAIASLFQVNQTQLLTLNYLNQSASLDIRPNQDILIPISCSCSGRFSQAFFNYTSPSSAQGTLLNIACGVFEGLLKAQTLVEQNHVFESNTSQGVEVIVPVRCACPDKTERRNGVKYLVTYPVVESDNTSFIASKFGVAVETIWTANNLEPSPTIFPQTTLLIPQTETPVLKLEIVSPENQSPAPVVVTPLEKLEPSLKRKNSNIWLGLGVSTAILFLFLAVVLFIYIRRRWHLNIFESLSPRSSNLSGLSPDFLDGMSKLKHSLINFTIEELQLSTGDFSAACAIGSSVHHGKIGGSHLAIEHVSSEDTAHQVVDILTRTNHLNIVKLEGYCYDTRPYLVFKFEENGSLRNCLSDSNVARELTWGKRMQIAFDLAVGLHYIHHCTSPSYVHRNINSRNVLISMEWRGKISGFKWAKPLVTNEENTHNSKLCESLIVGRKGYLAPEYMYNGLASSKVDIYAFGIVILELMSSKEAIMDGFMLKDSVGFLVEGALEGSSGCLEKLRGFMDPALEGNYPVGNAFCLALLAKGCVEEDPHRRPTMNDVLKALSRII